MGRALRTIAGGLVYHVLNRANARMRIFDKPKDREDGDISTFVGWLTLTHTQRWHAQRRSEGSGHVYQGRFKSFLVESDEYLWTTCRYVERNALRAGLCQRAEQWRWSSLWRRESADAECRKILSKWPIDAPKDWLGIEKGTSLISILLFNHQ
jgi:putative transposase